MIKMEDYTRENNAALVEEDFLLMPSHLNWHYTTNCQGHKTLTLPVPKVIRLPLYCSKLVGSQEVDTLIIVYVICINKKYLSTATYSITSLISLPCNGL